MTRGLVIRLTWASLVVLGLACSSYKGATVRTGATEKGTSVMVKQLECSLRVAPSHQVGAPMALRFRLGNPTSQALYVLAWQTPLEGFFGNYLRVTRDGTEIPYMGPMMKRGNPEAEDYVTVAAGGSVEASVDVSQAYDMTRPGHYQFQFEGRLLDVTAQEQSVPRPLSEHQAVSVRCPVVETTLVAP